MKSQADAKSILTICLGVEKLQQAQNIFRVNSGQLRMSELIDKGISRYMLYNSHVLTDTTSHESSGLKAADDPVVPGSGFKCRSVIGHTT